MNTLLLHHPVCQHHQMGESHPECPQRLAVLLAALQEDEFASLRWLQAPRATVQQLERVHTPGHVGRILQQAPQQGLRWLDADTALSPASPEAALLAAGAVCAAVDAVLTGTAINAFCAVRPPGHHAEAGKAMGFCLFNNVAVAAAQALAVHGLSRVAIVDFDVHHGNGTQAMFYRRPEVFYVSLHQMPLYPGTGHPEERGVGNILNVPLRAGQGSAELRRCWQDSIQPALLAFQPQLLLVSAGFDAHRLDPLAQLCWEDDDYVWLTDRLADVAWASAGGRMVSTLEGGYHLAALTASGVAHVRTLLQRARA